MAETSTACRKLNANDDELTDRVVHINRVAKVVKGGRRFSFSALVVVGDGSGVRRRRPRQGQRGAGGDPQGHRARAQEPVRGPARRRARIPHEVIGHFGAGARAAAAGVARYRRDRRRRGARGASRSAGVRDVLTKCSARATRTTWCARRCTALRELREPEERLAELRGDDAGEDGGAGMQQDDLDGDAR